MKFNTLLLSAAFLFSVLSSRAITFEELAGVYVGKRTETYPTSVQRYDEITVIEADGTVTNYVFVDELPEPFVTTGTLVLDDNGNFSVGENAQGHISLRGRHLSVSVQWNQTESSPEITVHFQGHRTEKDGWSHREPVTRFVFPK